jgi:hypothetical protein
MAKQTFQSRVPTDPYYNINLDVSTDDNDKCEAYDKGNLPGDIPATAANGQKITWLHNFGVRHKPDTTNAGKDINPAENITYTISLTLPQDPKNVTRTVCIYVGKKLQDIGSGGSGATITYKLKAGDPPTGVYP